MWQCPKGEYCIAVRLSWVGWNKRSGSTKRERDIFKVRSVIDVHLDLSFAGESLLHEGFFLLFQAIEFLLQGFDFFVSAREYRSDLLFLSLLQQELSVGGTAALVPPYV